MKYKITVQQVDPQANYAVKEVYEQVIEVNTDDEANTFVKGVIKAVNGIQ